MRDSLMPSRGSGNNKPALFLLAAGAIVMLIALIFVLRRHSENPETKPVTEERPEKPEVTVPKLTLVAPRPPSPIVRTEDGGVATPDNSLPIKTKKHKGAASASPGGKVDVKQVNTFINARFSQVKACYERRLKVNTFLEGKLDLNIGVLESGKVNAITVNKDTVRDEQMLACVKNTIRSWEFPKPEGGRVVIAKTFAFKKKGI